MVRLKRAYEKPSPSDGYRVLVERLWPRGVTRAAAALDAWLKEIAPSAELRTWFCHDEEKWPEFRRRYHAELARHPDIVEDLRARARKGTVTLVYGSRDQEHNAATVIKDYLEKAPRAVRSRTA